MELSNLALAELKQLLDSIPAEIKRREKNEKALVLKELQSLAAERGFSLDDLLVDGREKKVSNSVAAKYRNPQDATTTWTGRGRQPKWVVEFLASGGLIEQLTI